MSSDCIFCGIVSGEIPGRTVYEDDAVQAFLDANPLAPGHTLVVPKEHAETLSDATAAEAGALMEAARELAPRIEDAVDADATTVAVNNGEAAGQEVPHVHVHVVPRFEDDGIGPIHGLWRSRPDVSDDELDEIAAAVRGD